MFPLITAKHVVLDRETGEVKAVNLNGTGQEHTLQEGL